MATKCFIFLLMIILTLTGCYRMRASNGGAQLKAILQRTINTADIALPPGYKIEAVTTGLTFPSAAAFDDEGKLYVIETGYAYGEVWGFRNPFGLSLDTRWKVIYNRKWF